MAGPGTLPLIVVMGVSGSGKSTIAAGLAERLGVRFVEGDTLHSAANIRKMAHAIALTDEDRWCWLRAVGAAMEQERRAGRGVVVSCSALKRDYRDCIRAMVEGPVRFILLDGARDLIAGRMAGRQRHFMPPALLDSQIATLERPGAGENAVTLAIDAPVARLLDAAVHWVRTADRQTTEGAGKTL
jgi:gluconokinase